MRCGNPWTSGTQVDPRLARGDPIRATPGAPHRIILAMRKNVWGAPPSDLQLDLLLALFEGARGSADLAAAVGELRRREVPLATFYRQLQKAVDLGWVEVSDTPAEGGPDPSPGRGRPERWYGIKGAGERVLRAGMEQQQRRLARALDLGLVKGRTP